MSHHNSRDKTLELILILVIIAILLAGSTLFNALFPCLHYEYQPVIHETCTGDGAFRICKQTQDQEQVCTQRKGWGQ